MTDEKIKKITGRLSVVALRKLANSVRKRTGKATCIEVTFWAFDSGADEEKISLWIQGETKNYHVGSVVELRELIQKLTTKIEKRAI